MPPQHLPCKLHGAEFARRDLASPQGFSSLGAHGSAVSRGRVGHHTRTSRLDAAGLGDGGGFSGHFGTGAVRVELQGKLLTIGFVSVGAESSESGNSGDREETDRLVHGETPVKFKK